MRKAKLILPREIIAEFVPEKGKVVKTKFNIADEFFNKFKILATKGRSKDPEGLIHIAESELFEPIDDDVGEDQLPVFLVSDFDDEKGQFILKPL